MVLVNGFLYLVEEWHEYLNDLSGNQIVLCRLYLGHSHICLINYTLYVPVFSRNKAELILLNNYLPSHHS